MSNNTDNNWIYRLLITLFGKETIYGKYNNDNNEEYLYTNEEDKKVHQAITSAKRSVDTLEKKKNHLQRNLNNITNDIKIMQVEGNKSNALTHAKKAVKIKKQIIDIDNKINTIEGSIYSLENAQQNNETINTINNLNKTIKSILNGDNIKNIEDIIEDNHNIEEASNDISEILNQSYSSKNSDMLQLEAEDFLNDIDYTDITNINPIILNTNDNNDKNKEKNNDSDDDNSLLEMLNNDMMMNKEDKITIDEINIELIPS